MIRKNAKYKNITSIISTLTMMFIFLILIVLGVSYSSFSIFPADIVENSTFKNTDVIKLCNLACNNEGGKYISSINEKNKIECKCKTFKIAGEIYNKTQNIISENKFKIISTTYKQISIKTNCNVTNNKNLNENNKFLIKWNTPYFFIVNCNSNINYNYINANPLDFGYDKNVIEIKNNSSISKDRFKRLIFPFLIIFTSLIVSFVILNKLNYTLEDFKELIINKNEENPLIIIISILFIITLIIILFRIYI